MSEASRHLHLSGPNLIPQKVGEAEFESLLEEVEAVSGAPHCQMKKIPVLFVHECSHSELAHAAEQSPGMEQMRQEIEGRIVERCCGLSSCHLGRMDGPGKEVGAGRTADPPCCVECPQCSTVTGFSCPLSKHERRKLW